MRLNSGPSILVAWRTGVDELLAKGGALVRFVLDKSDNHAVQVEEEQDEMETKLGK